MARPGAHSGRRIYGRPHPRVTMSRAGHRSLPEASQDVPACPFTSASAAVLVPPPPLPISPADVPSSAAPPAPVGAAGLLPLPTTTATAPTAAPAIQIPAP